MSTLIAPSHHVANLNEHSSRNPNPLPGAQHYVVTRRITNRLAEDKQVVFDAGVTYLAYPENVMVRAQCEQEAQRLNQESFDQFIRGRKFTRYTGSSGVAEVVEIDEQEARRLMDISHPGDPLTVTPDVGILYISNVEFGRVLWSDGKITKKPAWWPSDCGSISQAAALLASDALRGRKAWRANDAWHKLLPIARVERETLRQFDDNYRGIGFRGNDEWKLDRITTDIGLTLYEVSQVGGSLGEDGDAWEHYYIYETEHEAQAAFRQEILSVLGDLLATAARFIESGSFVYVAEAWPMMAEYAKQHFDVTLPLQPEFADALAQYQAANASDWDEPPEIDPHGWAMYLKGFAKAL